MTSFEETLILFSRLEKTREQNSTLHTFTSHVYTRLRPKKKPFNADEEIRQTRFDGGE